MSYQYLVHRNLSKKQVIERYEAFTFPSFLQKSKVRNLQEPFFVIEALHQQERVGVAVLELRSANAMMKVLSLLVKEEYRRQGIASHILQIAEKIAINHRLSYMNIIFQNNWESFKWMPRLLQNLGWNEPQKRLILVKLSYNQIKDLPWFQIKDYPTNFSVKPWKSLSPEQYDYIKQKKAEQQWYPDELSPFQIPDLVIDEGSWVLFYQQEIVGWLICHLVGQKLMQVSSYFIDELHRKTKASIAIVANAIDEVWNKGIAEEAIFMFRANNEAMITLAKKFAGQHNTGAFTEVWVGQKQVS